VLPTQGALREYRRGGLELQGETFPPEGVRSPFWRETPLEKGEHAEAFLWSIGQEQHKVSLYSEDVRLA